MDRIPDFWRAEVWHPLSVHFPIALLIFATVSYILSLFIKEQKAWSFMAKVLLIFGVLAAWIGIYTGNMADGAVSRKICDPTVLKDHEIGAYTLSIIFSAALALFVVADFNLIKKSRKILQFVILGLLLVGSGFLVYTGHLGATVVYQQGAGVYHPSSDCSEFSE